jgi:uncharacterized membrane protein
MSLVHIHLLLNHIPVVGMGIALLLFAVAVIRKSDELVKVILSLFIALAVVSIPVYLTGDPAKDVVKHMPDVSRDLIEAHDDAASYALATVEVLGVASLVGLFLFRRSPMPRWFVIVILILSVVSSAAMARTAYLGGQIRHSEIRSGTAPVESHHDSDSDKD